MIPAAFTAKGSEKGFAKGADKGKSGKGNKGHTDWAAWRLELKSRGEYFPGKGKGKGKQQDSGKSSGKSKGKEKEKFIGKDTLKPEEKYAVVPNPSKAKEGEQATPPQNLTVPKKEETELPSENEELKSPVVVPAKKETTEEKFPSLLEQLPVI